MAAGDAQKVWFPELIEMVRQAGDPADVHGRLAPPPRSAQYHPPDDTPHAADPAGPDVVSALPVRHRAAPQRVRAGYHPGVGAQGSRPPPRSRPLEKRWNRYRNNISWIGMASRRTRWPRLANAPVSRGECLRDKPSRVLLRPFHDCLPTRQRNVRYHDRSAAPMVRAACWSALLSRLASA